ncbi:MAG: DUF3800 domain-containing protein [Bacteroidetes bacterium]|nr:DUF3800 domain-containing protein [Bacteroidota bacterium]
MAYFFFIDESGTDHDKSPYEVLCGVSINDCNLWNMISQLKQHEEQLFGMRYGTSHREIKGQTFLKSKVFKHAALHPPIPAEERTTLARECLSDGKNSTTRHWAALAQAKLEYVKRLLDLCIRFRVRVFATISSESGKPRITDGDPEGLLRRDYVYVLERMYYYLDEKRLKSKALLFLMNLKSHTAIN